MIKLLRRLTIGMPSNIREWVNGPRRLGCYSVIPELNWVSTSNACVLFPYFFVLGPGSGFDPVPAYYSFVPGSRQGTGWMISTAWTLYHGACPGPPARTGWMISIALSLFHGIGLLPWNISLLFRVLLCCALFLLPPLHQSRPIILLILPLLQLHPPLLFGDSRNAPGHRQGLR